MSDFYKKLREVLVIRYGSLTEASKRLGVTVSFLSQILKGKKHLPTQLKEKLIKEEIPEELFEQYNWESDGKKKDNEVKIIKATYEEIIFHQKGLIKTLMEATNRLQKEAEFYRIKSKKLQKKLTEYEFKLKECTKNEES